MSTPITDQVDFVPALVRVIPVREVLEQYRDGDEHGWQTEFDLLRTTMPGQIARLTVKIAAHGITEPVLLGSDGRVWDGHKRLCVADALGRDVPVYEVTKPDPREEISRAVYAARDALAPHEGTLSDDLTITSAQAATIAVRAVITALRPDLAATMPEAPAATLTDVARREAS